MKRMTGIAVLAAFIAAGCLGCSGGQQADTDQGRRARLLEEENYRMSRVIAQHEAQIEALNAKIEQLEAEKARIEEAGNESVTFLMGLMADKEAELADCLERLEKLQQRRQDP